MSSINIQRKFNPIQSPCRNCTFCGQYKDQMFCKKGKPGAYWAMDENGECEKFQVKQYPTEDYIPWDEANVKELLLDGMSTIACITIQDRVSPQATAAIKKFLTGITTFKNLPDLPVGDILIMSKLSKTKVLKVLELTEKALQPLKLNTPIENTFRKEIFDLHGQLGKFWEN
jgi:hypothetical protein